MERIENKDICAICQGYCCKKSGCDYFVSDLKDQSIETIEELLDSGKASIIASLSFGRTYNGVVTCTPILSLRARCVGRGPIDLLSFKTRCAALTETGCPYPLEERPSGAAAVIPDKDRNCKSTADKIAEARKWEILQKKLARIVKRRTGKGIYTVLEEDAEELFFNVINSNFDGVMPEELEEVNDMLPILTEAYPNALERARARSQKGQLRVLTQNKRVQ